MREWLPSTFIFSPSDPTKSEFEAFEAAFRSRAARLGPAARNAWILKPSDGSKGERIQIHDDLETILRHLRALPKGTIAWVVSEYIHRPLLLPGSRKFDWRLWVLLDHNYSIFMFREGVLRTCSSPFSLDNLNDTFAHLSNHCIQVEASRYGEYEPTNEMFHEEFEALIGKHRFQRVLLPQARHIVRETLVAARDTLECIPAVSGVNAFNVFGFDLMVDADDRVWLIEVNSSPAVADAILPRLARDLIKIQLIPYFLGPVETCMEDEKDDRVGTTIGYPENLELAPHTSDSEEAKKEEAEEASRAEDGPARRNAQANGLEDRGCGWELLYEGTTRGDTEGG